MPEGKVAAIIVAAGDSRRMGGEDKMFAPLGGRPMLARVLDTFETCRKIDEIYVVINKKSMDEYRRMAAQGNWYKVKDVRPGGKRRQDSVAEGLKALSGPAWVVIHDGARPLVTADLIERGLEAAKETGAAVAAVPVIDTIKAVGEREIVRQTLPRQYLRAVQTPQVFRYDTIKNTYEYTVGEVTDDAALVEKAGYKVKLYPGSYDNIKITTVNDLAVAEVLLKKYGH
jgi:2-C-methyl-D-erythritol 4-phosphate cytidylyltransferase